MQRGAHRMRLPQMRSRLQVRTWRCQAARHMFPFQVCIASRDALSDAWLHLVARNLMLIVIINYHGGSARSPNALVT